MGCWDVLCAEEFGARDKAELWVTISIELTASTGRARDRRLVVERTSDVPDACGSVVSRWDLRTAHTDALEVPVDREGGSTPSI
jgi:hypothetical protein